MTLIKCFAFLFSLLKSKDLTLPETKDSKPAHSTQEDEDRYNEYHHALALTNNLNFQRDITQFKIYKPNRGTTDAKGEVSAIAMDDNIKDQFGVSNSSVPLVQLLYFAQQGFIGYQMCSILNQHWLIAKACVMGARDAIRKGYNVTVDKNTTLPDGVIDDIIKLDKKFKIKRHLVEFARKNRVFGVRVAIFKVKSNDPKYYEKPFNIKGVGAGCYIGIKQVDPNWITPELDNEGAADPASLHFYEPTWWRVNGQRYHKSHLVVARYGEVDDVLKPTYFFGGVSLVQQLANRVYTAERTANETPELALTKRLNIIYTDIAKVSANQAAFEDRIKKGARLRTNYGVLALDKEDEKYEQTDTSLTDFDTVTMNLFQLVSSIAKVPATKLLGTTLKGFNATGEYEENNYHEELESIQSDEFEPFLQKHHQLLIASEIAPKHGTGLFETTISWLPLDSTTAKGKAENNKLKSETGLNYITGGVISQADERKRLSEDPESGYHGIPVDEIPETDDDDDGFENEENTNDPAE